MTVVSTTDAKQLQANTVRRQNRVAAKTKLMDQSMVAPK
jgi:hypothetical protein